MTPWFFLSLNSAHYNYENLRKEYPARLLVPFARSGAYDYVACFVAASESEGQGQVIVLNDRRPAGAEVVAVFEDFVAWLRAACDDMLEYLRLGPTPNTWDTP